MTNFMPLIFFFSPFPVFFDFSTMNLLMSHVDSVDELLSLEPQFPIPISALCLVSYLGVGLLGVILRTKKFDLFESKTPIIISIILLYLFALNFVLKLSIISFVQIYSLVFLIATTPFIRNQILLYKCSLFFFYGIVFWSINHFLSIVVNNDFSLINVDRDFNFGRIWGFPVYQAWVSYPTSLSMQIIFVYFLSEAKIINKFSSYFVISIILTLGFFGQTRLFILDSIVFLFLLLYQTFRRLGSLNLQSAIGLVFTSSLCIIGILTYGARLFEKGAADRFELIKEAIDLIVSDFGSYMIFGSGAIHSFAHNFLLDFVLNNGIVLALVYLLLFAVALWRILRISNKHVSTVSKLPFLVALTVILLQNSFFNTALTQPLAFASYTLTLILILSFAPIAVKRQVTGRFTKLRLLQPKNI
jgi:hypothetical protein